MVRGANEVMIEHGQEWVVFWWYDTKNEMRIDHLPNPHAS